MAVSVTECGLCSGYPSHPSLPVSILGRFRGPTPVPAPSSNLAAHVLIYLWTPGERRWPVPPPGFRPPAVPSGNYTLFLLGPLFPLPTLPYPPPPMLPTQAQAVPSSPEETIPQSCVVHTSPPRSLMAEWSTAMPRLQEWGTLCPYYVPGPR